MTVSNGSILHYRDHSIFSFLFCFVSRILSSFASFRGLCSTRRGLVLVLRPSTSIRMSRAVALSSPRGDGIPLRATPSTLTKSFGSAPLPSLSPMFSSFLDNLLALELPARLRHLVLVFFSWTGNASAFYKLGISLHNALQQGECVLEVKNGSKPFFCIPSMREVLSTMVRLRDLSNKPRDDPSRKARKQRIVTNWRSMKDRMFVPCPVSRGCCDEMPITSGRNAFETLNSSRRLPPEAVLILSTA